MQSTNQYSFALSVYLDTLMRRMFMIGWPLLVVALVPPGCGRVVMRKERNLSRKYSEQFSSVVKEQIILFLLEPSIIFALDLDSLALEKLY